MECSKCKAKVSNIYVYEDEYLCEKCTYDRKMELLKEAIAKNDLVAIYKI